jgi:hypothetical protein
LWTQTKPRDHPNRANRDVPQSNAGEQPSRCGVRADGVSIVSAAQLTRHRRSVGGVWTAHLMFELPVWQFAIRARTGAGQWLAEAVATFGLLLTVFGCVAQRPQSVPYAVGLYITAAYWLWRELATAWPRSPRFRNPRASISSSHPTAPSVAWPRLIRESVTRLPLCADKLQLSVGRNGLGQLISRMDAFCVDPIAMKVRLRWSGK